MKKYPSVNWKVFQPQPVVGVDEAGRGCLAGPVFASAVILKTDDSYTDSKQIPPEIRKKMAEMIIKKHIYAIGMATVEEIERLNILQATFLAMKRAVMRLSIQTGHVLVDGNALIPALPEKFQQTAFVKGDQRVAPISGASIVAKVKRDEWITKQDHKFPQYGFARHKGYATVQHRKAIAQYGPCALHRKTFSGVKEYLSDKVF